MHSLYFHCCVCAEKFFFFSPWRVLRQLRKVKGQRQVLTQHHGAARSPGAPAPPAVCSPGSSSLPGYAAPSCGGCAGWASGSAAQIAAVSWCWSGDREGGTRLSSHYTRKATCQVFTHWQKSRLFQTSERWLISLLCDENVCNSSVRY